MKSVASLILGDCDLTVGCTLHSNQSNSLHRTGHHVTQSIHLSAQSSNSLPLSSLSNNTVSFPAGHFAIYIYTTPFVRRLRLLSLLRPAQSFAVVVIFGDVRPADKTTAQLFASCAAPTPLSSYAPRREKPSLIAHTAVVGSVDQGVTGPSRYNSIGV